MPIYSDSEPILPGWAFLDKPKCVYTMWQQKFIHFAGRECRERINGPFMWSTLLYKLTVPLREFLQATLKEETGQVFPAGYIYFNVKSDLWMNVNDHFQVAVIIA